MKYSNTESITPRFIFPVLLLHTSLVPPEVVPSFHQLWQAF